MLMLAIAVRLSAIHKTAVVGRECHEAQFPYQWSAVRTGRVFNADGGSSAQLSFQTAVAFRQQLQHDTDSQ
jgi:hypothetical protein